MPSVIRPFYEPRERYNWFRDYDGIQTLFVEHPDELRQYSFDLSDIVDTAAGESITATVYTPSGFTEFMGSFLGTSIIWSAKGVGSVKVEISVADNGDTIMLVREYRIVSKGLSGDAYR